MALFPSRTLATTHPILNNGVKDMYNFFDYVFDDIWDRPVRREPRKPQQGIKVEITSYAATPEEQKKEIATKLRELADKVEAESTTEVKEEKPEPTPPAMKVDRWVV